MLLQRTMDNLKDLESDLASLPTTRISYDKMRKLEGKQEVFNGAIEVYGKCAPCSPTNRHSV